MAPGSSIEEWQPVCRVVELEVERGATALVHGQAIAIFRTDSPIKGMIRQTMQDVELKAKAEGSEYEFDNNAWQFGIDVWRGVNFGYWQRACQVQMT